MNNTKDFPIETLEQLCEQAGNETDSDRLQQLARKIIQRLGDRRSQILDDLSEDSDSAV